MPKSNKLFLTQDGRPLNKNRVETIIKRYGLKAGIQGVRVSPHTFRHTGAVMFLRNGGDLFTLKRITGHTDLKSLQTYLNLSQSDISRVHADASPVDNLGITPKTHRKKKTRVPVKFPHYQYKCK
jgi:integrase/recombinase XerD